MTSQDLIRYCEFCGKPMKNVSKSIKLSSGEELSMPPIFLCDCKQFVEDGERKAKEIYEKEERKRVEKLKNKCLKFGVKPHFIESKSGSEYMDRVLSGGLYIAGETGVGKTYLASGIAKRCVLAGKTIRFTTSSEVIMQLRGTFAFNQAEDEIINPLCSCDVLFLDDLGKESPTDYVLERLFYIINRRYEYDKPIVVTSQFKRSELAKRLSKNGDKETAEAIVRRLKDMCGEVVTLG